MLNEICKQGAFPNVFIYHICGMPWASTNSVEFTKWITDTGADQTALRAKLFGDDSLNVQVLATLGNAESNQLGSQSISYVEDKGLSVGGWSVSLSGDNAGFVWKNGTAMEQWGIIGLGWQPVESTEGVGHSVLSYDVTPDLVNDNECIIRWDKNKDFGLYDWLNDHWDTSAYDEDLYIYVGSSCIKPISVPVVNSSFYWVECESGKLNAPNEDILALSQQQNIFVSNYPQGIEGLTANLYSVLFKDGELLSGTTPYFMRTGKVKNNATEDSSGNWKLSMGGFTEQFKFKNTIGSYSGFLQGFRLNKTNYETSSRFDEYHMPFLYVIERLQDSTSDNITPVISTIELTNNYEEFDSVSQIIEYAKDLLNSDSSLTLDYSIEGDNIVVSLTDAQVTAGDTISSCSMGGTMPFITGIGRTITAESYTYYLNTMSDPINANFVQFSDEDGGADDQGTIFYLSEKGDGIPPTRDIDGSKLYMRTKPLDYFIQYDLSSQTTRRIDTDAYIFENSSGSAIPEDSNGDQMLTISTSSESSIELQVGMSIQFGNFGDADSGLSIKGEINGLTANADDPTRSDATFVSNLITGSPMAMYSCSGIVDAINNNENDYIIPLFIYGRAAGTTVENVKDMFSGDLFAIKDIETIVLESGSDIFRGILGDPNVDVGFNIGAIKTDIKNLFDRGESNFVPMVNWDKFEELLEANAINGVRFKYTPESNGVDVLALLSGVCLTYNIQMIWEYSSDNRAWWLTFDDFGAGNGTTATLNGRSISTQDIAVNNLTAIVGGGWYYNKLAGSYKTTDGNNLTLNYQLTDGRVGHSLHDKVLTVNDKITLLPVDSIAAQDAIIEHFTAMTRLFSQIVYKQKLTLNLRKTALLGVGRWSRVAWAPIQNRQTGRRNDGDLIGQFQSMSIDLSNGVIMVDVLSYPNEKTGISPSLYADGGSMTRVGNVITLTNINTNPLLNDFGDKDSLLTDLMYFGCISQEAGSLVDRDCDCTGYRVTVFERNPTNGKLYFDPNYGHTSRNVYRGTMDKVTTTTGSTVDITLDGDASLLSTSKDWVVTFADRADSGLQSCQTDYFGWIADSKNQVTTSTGAKKAGIKVGN